MKQVDILNEIKMTKRQLLCGEIFYEIYRSRF